MNLIKKENFIPFIGFSFNGIHSSSLGIVRVSSNNRYSISLNCNENVTTNDLVGNGVEVSRVDMLGKPISLNIAFDSLTEEQLNNLKKVFCTESLGELVLDETPYKKLLVKSNGTQQIKYLCFLEKGQRIYKGEGTLTFESISPFYECTSPYLDDYFDYNINDWASDNNDFLITYYPIYFYQKELSSSRQPYNTSIEGSNFYFWTPASPRIPIDPTIYLYINSSDRDKIHSISISLSIQDLEQENTPHKAASLFQLKNLNLKNKDSFLILNFKKYLAYGASEIDDKIIPNGNDYYKNISTVSSKQIDKRDIPYHWNQNGYEIDLEQKSSGLTDLSQRPRIEVTFYRSNIPDNKYELTLAPRTDLTKERHTGIYDVRYTNKVY